jgi:CBS domain-containing protein
LLEVMRTLDEKKLSVLAVIRDNGQLLGLLEKQAIVKLMQGQMSKMRSAAAD